MNGHEPNEISRRTKLICNICLIIVVTMKLQEIQIMYVPARFIPVIYESNLFLTLFFILYGSFSILQKCVVIMVVMPKFVSVKVNCDKY